MRQFLSDKWVPYIKWIFACCFFTLFFLYFFSINKFHLLYLEQLQLFRFSGDYFQQFTAKPGDLIFFLGEFLCQFFISSFVAAGIITLLGVLIYLLFTSLLKKLGIYGFLWSLLPLVLLAAVQSDFQYKPALTIGVIVALGADNIYIRTVNRLYRLLLGLVMWIGLYYIAGGFALFASILFILSELFYFKQKLSIVNVLAILLISLAVPYLSWKFVFFINFKDAWLFPFPFWGATKILVFGALLAYFPIVILILSIIKYVEKAHKFIISWNYITVLLGCAVLVISIIYSKKYSYDLKTEILLGMDHYVQQQNWNKVLKLSKEYPGRNQLILYYTNLALYKTGQLGDRMFDFRQGGIGGLRLEWKRNEVAPFFGGEIFYHLNYFNEAFRWAFESMEVKGLNPRSLKRLVLTSIINQHYTVASKYIDFLDQSLYYKSWATKCR